MSHKVTLLLAMSKGPACADLKVALLGVIRSLFEASMYTFVFPWTPALSPVREKLALGNKPVCSKISRVDANCWQQADGLPMQIARLPCSEQSSRCLRPVCTHSCSCGRLR